MKRFSFLVLVLVTMSSAAFADVSVSFGYQSRGTSVGVYYGSGHYRPFYPVYVPVYRPAYQPVILAPPVVVRPPVYPSGCYDYGRQSVGIDVSVYRYQSRSVAPVMPHRAYSSDYGYRASAERSARAAEREREVAEDFARRERIRAAQFEHDLRTRQMKLDYERKRRELEKESTQPSRSGSRPIESAPQFYR